MKRIQLLALFLLFSVAAVAQKTTWKIDPAHSKMQFNITHMKISEVTGNFTDFKGKAVTEGDNFEGADVSVTIQVNSINTDNEKRDNHLKSKDFFYAEKYPEITFESKSLKKVSGKKYKLKGDLTMRGTTKEVTLDAEYKGKVKSPMSGKTKAGFHVTGTIDRTEYGINYNQKLESGGWLIGEKVDLNCSVELVKQ